MIGEFLFWGRNPKTGYWLAVLFYKHELLKNLPTLDAFKNYFLTTPMQGNLEDHVQQFIPKEVEVENNDGGVKVKVVYLESIVI